jgi:protein TonB
MHMALFLSLILHAVLVIWTPIMKGSDAAIEKGEKLAIKFLTPVERVAAAASPVATSAAQLEQVKAPINTPLYQTAVSSYRQQTTAPTPFTSTPTKSVVSTTESVVSEVVAPVSSGSGEAAKTTNEGSYRLPEYLAIVRATVERNKEYPALAKRMGVEGYVVVRLALDESGYAQSIDLLSSSGNKHLDTAALTAVRNSQPFQAPRNFGLASVTVDIPISYRID